jgi:4-amino-4-deoxy-L-arabinose transferase-like glycosyltransferase
MRKTLNNLIKFIKKNKIIILVLVIFSFELFFRFYQIEQKSPFGFDQVDNAWAAQKIIVHHDFPLVGMVAKGNSGIFIGPVYYYMVAFFYWIFDLNPIASGVLAGITSIFTFWVIFFVAKKLFSVKVAIIAVFINTFILPAIIFDRIQWPVNFIPSVSLLIFYVLYRITLGDYKKIIHLALLIGFSFSIHFTSIFFPIIIILTLPFFPRNKKTLKYIFISLPLFFIWLVPNIIYQLGQKSGSASFTSYFNDNYHGFHLRRLIQLVGDGLIQFNPYLLVDKYSYLKFILFPLFFILYLYKSISRKNLVFCYLILLWFLVPWIIFSAYKGEISDYYFSINRFIVLLIISYFIVKIWMVKNIVPKTVIVLLLIFIFFTNLINFFSYKEIGLKEKESVVLSKIKNKEKIKFQWGAPESYLYYYFLRQKGITVY